MILAIDVQYENDQAIVAGVMFSNWNDSEPQKIIISEVNEIAPYIPGQFYKRELPCIKALLDEHQIKPNIIIVDGFVFLDTNSKKGLGCHLYDLLKKSVKIIGVAKNPFKNIPEEFKLYRGNSSKPLFVTSIGYTLEDSKEYIKSMAGDFRIPKLLKLVDSVCRNPNSYSLPKSKTVKG